MKFVKNVKRMKLKHLILKNIKSNVINMVTTREWKDKLIGKGIGWAITNPWLALAIVVVLIIVLVILGGITLATAISLSMNPVLWGVCLALVALFKPDLKSILPWGAIIGVIFWLYGIISSLLVLQTNPLCQIPILGWLGCGLYSGAVIMGGLFLIPAYIITSFLMTWGLSFIYNQISKRIK